MTDPAPSSSPTPPSSPSRGRLWKAIRSVADRATLRLLDLPFFDRLVGFLAYQRKRKIRRRVEARLRAEGKYGDAVERGPFKGMTYPPPEVWVSARFEKIVGAYEAELHDQISELVEGGKAYSSIINIGAAEGYFSVGFARLFPEAKGYSFELQEECRRVLGDLAALNGVSDRIEVSGFCDPPTLAALEAGTHPLVVCDVDGYEEVLMDLDAVPWLRHADILLELHDIFIPGLTETIRRRFEDTHDIRQYTVTGIPYADYPVFRELTFIEIDAMVGSDRRGMQDWFFMEPKSKQPEG